MKKIVVGISGASGMGLALELLLQLKDEKEVETILVYSRSAVVTLEHECDADERKLQKLADRTCDIENIGDEIASGSAKVDGMIIIPCSMKTVAGIACGYSDNLLLRAADVMIKEHRPLVLVPRETPLSPIHLKNLYEISTYGVMIVPPMICGYRGEESFDEYNRQFAARCLGYLGIQKEAFEWRGIK